MWKTANAFDLERSSLATKFLLTLTIIFAIACRTFELFIPTIETMLISNSNLAMPVIRSLGDCADFSRTVAPYIPQLSSFPQDLVSSMTNVNDLKALYLSTNPVISAIALSLALSPVVLVVSEINRNYSQVDRMWSILPTLYNLHYTIWAHMSGIPSERLDTLLACSCIWSARLTFNYWRKGGYSIGSEDYRWEVLRSKIRPSLFFLFNVTFISLAQNLLLVAITFPTYVILLASRFLKSQMTTSDIVFSRVMAGVVLVEFFADQQQWRFQGAKKQYQKTAKVPPKFAREDLDRGFIVSGLWSLSRHPNFAAEMTFWVALYQWSCFATDTFYNWAGVGAIGYIMLFEASTWFTELITAGKYPEYKEYQQRVGKFLPKFWS